MPDVEKIAAFYNFVEHQHDNFGKAQKAESDHLSIIGLLAKEGVDPNIMDNKGFTVIDILKASRQQKLATRLLKDLKIAIDDNTKIADKSIISNQSTGSAVPPVNPVHPSGLGAEALGIIEFVTKRNQDNAAGKRPLSQQDSLDEALHPKGHSTARVTPNLSEGYKMHKNNITVIDWSSTKRMRLVTDATNQISNQPKTSIIPSAQSAFIQQHGKQI